MPELTDISVIRALCEKYDFALSKGFGQNFIINPGIPTKIVDASGVDKRYGVIEIGPGIGVLTKELAKRAAKVVSIEVDERLPPLLAETMAGVDNFKLVLQDVLKVDLKALIEAEFPGMPVAVCANLPYYITSPIVMKLLGDRLPIESLTVMVQKEAADRLAAVPGTRASSAISCAVNYYATSRLMFTAAPQDCGQRHCRRSEPAQGKGHCRHRGVRVRRPHPPRGPYPGRFCKDPAGPCLTGLQTESPAA